MDKRKGSITTNYMSILTSHQCYATLNRIILFLHRVFYNIGYATTAHCGIVSITRVVCLNNCNFVKVFQKIYRIKWKHLLTIIPK